MVEVVGIAGCALRIDVFEPTSPRIEKLDMAAA
jgi:hypothetical protein